MLGIEDGATDIEGASLGNELSTADKLGLSVGTEDGSYGIGSYGIEGAWLGMELGDDDGCDEGCILIYLGFRLVEMLAN